MPAALTVTHPTDNAVSVSRSFDAPADLVFACHTKPQLVQRWQLGPPGWTMPICEIDLRVGAPIAMSGAAMPMAPSSASPAAIARSPCRP